MRNNEFDFNEEITEEDPAEDEMIECLAALLREEQERNLGRTAVMVPAQMRRFVNACKAVKRMADGVEGIKVLCDICEPVMGMGCISVICRNILFGDPRLFVYLVNEANNAEAYPKTDGTVQMNFTFYGLTAFLPKNE